MLYIYEILLSGWIIYCCIITYLINITVDKYKKFVVKESEEVKKEFTQYNRDDCLKWNKLSMMLVGCFVVPIRILFSIGAILTMLIGFGIVRMFPQSVLKKIGYRIVGKIAAKLVLLTFGYHYVKRQKKKVEEYLEEYKTERKIQDKDIPIIIGNHVSFIDVFYMIYQYQNAFLGKKEASSVLIFKFAADACEGIWVERQSKDHRSLVLEAIVQRTQYFLQDNNHAKLNPLLIFPEGTTSNGRQLLSFKQGAFVPLKPVKVVCLDYMNQDFINFLDLEGEPANILICITQLWNTLTVTEFNFDPAYINAMDISQNEKVIKYTHDTQLLISKVLNIPTTQKGYYDYEVYNQIKKSNYTICIQQAKDILQNKRK